MKLYRTIYSLDKYHVCQRVVNPILIYQKAVKEGCIKITRCIDKISFRRQIAMICIL